MRRAAIGTLAVFLVVYLAARAAADQSAPAVSSSTGADLVARFLADAGPALTSYRAFRTLEAEAHNGHVRGRLTAWTTLDPDKGFNYAIVQETGSGIICRKVLRAALEAERSTRATGEADRGAVTSSNYEFEVASAPEGGFVRVDIHPKRVDTLLIEGSILLNEVDGDLADIEGLLVKRPSFWTREVRVERRYERLEGIRVPVSMRSTARVLIVGRSTFSMEYEYTSINGLTVASNRPESGRR